MIIDWYVNSSSSFWHREVNASARTRHSLTSTWWFSQCLHCSARRSSKMYFWNSLGTASSTNFEASEIPCIIIIQVRDLAIHICHQSNVMSFLHNPLVQIVSRLNGAINHWVIYLLIVQWSTVTKNNGFDLCIIFST